MAVNTINIPIDIIINILKQLNRKEKEEIFERVFIDEDTQPLSQREKESIAKAQQEFEEGKTIAEKSFQLSANSHLNMKHETIFIRIHPCPIFF